MRINKEKGGVDFVELTAPTFIMIKPRRSVYYLCRNIYTLWREMWWGVAVQGRPSAA